MIAISYGVVEDTIAAFKANIDKHTASFKLQLEAILSGPGLNVDRYDYITELLKIADSLIVAKPEEIAIYKNNLDAIISGQVMDSKPYKAFRDQILLALGYEEKRDNFYPEYFYGLGIKACVYCNSQLTVSLEKLTPNGRKKKKIYKAKFQVDHYIAKSKYPGFSISLFNLYPVCGSCNNCKGQQIVNFKLYSILKQNDSAFQFKLENGSVANFILSRKLEDIKYSFIEPSVIIPSKKFEDVFNVQGIYNTQKDLAEELILKAEIYTDQYKKTLKGQFKKLFTTPDIFNRLMLGNYSSESDIHKRPMAKFTIDIAKQLGLIKKNA